MRDGEAGFTLVETIVALGLFALISLAALSMVETVLGAQRRTDGRLERLAQIDRAMHLIDRDFSALNEGPLLDGESIGFKRAIAGGSALAGYGVFGGQLMRLQALTPRLLLPGVVGIDWSFHRDGAWRADPGKPTDPRPDGIALTMRLAQGGTLRRVVALPVTP